MPTPRPIEKISAVIITLNEEACIARCLHSLIGVAEEILVIDGGSRDRTCERCEAGGARVIRRAFDGFSSQKNFGIRAAAYDKILSVDADETLSDRLRDAIVRAKACWEKDAYVVRRLNRFDGKWIRHGEWRRDRAIRLFDRDKAHWEGGLHERVRMAPGARTGRIEGYLLHDSYPTLLRFHRKTSLYGALAAARMHQQGLRPGFFHLYLKPAYRFFLAFVLRMGFLDGKTGWLIARLTAGRLYVKYAKLKALADARESPAA